jgi:hypothetical protein
MHPLTAPAVGESVAGLRRPERSCGKSIDPSSLERALRHLAAALALQEA